MLKHHVVLFEVSFASTAREKAKNKKFNSSTSESCHDTAAKFLKRQRGSRLAGEKQRWAELKEDANLIS